MLYLVIEVEILPTFPLQSHWLGQGDQGFEWHSRYWSCLKRIHTKDMNKKKPHPCTWDSKKGK